jgi:hypothetical protein
MERPLPKELQGLVLREFEIFGSPEPSLKGLVLHVEKGPQRCIVTRQQLLDIARACARAAASMPKPS